MPDGLGEDKFSEIEKKIASLEEKADAVEDMVMAENLGMVELKKALDEMRTITPSPPSEFEERIKKLEENLASLSPEAVGVKPPEDQIRPVMKEVEVLKEELEAVKTFKGIDFKPIFEEISRLRQNTDSRFLVVEKGLESLEEKSKFQLPEKVLEEVRRIREEYRERIEAMEKFVGDFARRVEIIRPYLERSENLERIAVLSREAEEKLQRFREVEESLKRLGSEMQASYAGINERLERIRGMEREFARFSDMLAMLRKEIDDDRVEILQRVKREDVNKMIKEVERSIPTAVPQIEMLSRKINEMERKTAFYGESLRRNVEEMKSFVDSRISELKASSLIEARFDELTEKTISFESRLGAIERVIKETLRGQPVVIE